MADYAIHDTTLIGTSNIIRKKEGSSALIDPADYPKRINLMGMLEEKSASGSIVTFSDGADDVPTKSLVVTIPPTLTGVSEVSVTQTGKNLLVNNIEDGATGGITYTKNSDGSISCSGTVSSVNSTRLIGTQVLPNGSYILSGADSSINLRAVLYDSNGSVITNRNDTGSGVTISVDSTVSYIEIRIKARTNAEQVSTTISPMLAVGSTVQTYEPYAAPTTYTASLGRTVHGGEVDIVNGTGTDENGDDFTFSPVEINSRLGNNTMWSEQGNTEVTYRASGTVTPIVPTLISKNITANGTYTASDDNVDGYDTVAVNVASPEPTVTPLNSPNAFMTISGITGTDVTRVAITITAPSDGKYVFASDSTCMTNTGSGDGFIDIQKNDVSVVKQYMSANTTTAITIPDIDVEAGDEVDIVVGFDNAHSSCNFQLYTGIAFVTDASASLLSMMPSEEETENTEEVEENEQNESEG